MCVINNRTGYHSTAIRSTDNSVLRLCCCPVRHSSSSVMPSAGIIGALVVASKSPLGTTSKGSSPVVAATSLPPSLGLDPAHHQDSRGRQNEIECPIPLGRSSVVCLVC
nr:hypothetical protein Itr_chr12CG14370 [Ipomoea trifida]